MKTIETDRLILRAWTPEDAPGMFEYAKSPLVGPAAGWEPHKTIEDSVEYLKIAIEENETWAVTQKTDAFSAAPGCTERGLRRCASSAMFCTRISGDRAL